MTGHAVVLDGRPVTYLAAGEPVPRIPDLRRYVPEYDEVLSDHPRVRRILRPLVAPTPIFYQALHWADGTDLTIVDDKVRRGIATEADFAGALVVEPRAIGCLVCRAHLRTLAVDGGELIFQSRLRLAPARFKSTCPACGATSLRTAGIVELLGYEAPS